MTLPARRKIYRSAIAEFWFDDNGILYCNANETQRTIENITESFMLVEEITEGKRVCLLVDMTNTGVQTRKERDFATRLLPHYYKAMAVISGSDFGRAIANIFLKIYNLPIPVKLCRTEREAKEWLKQFLEETEPAEIKCS